jgi:outer membrane protein
LEKFKNSFIVIAFSLAIISTGISVWAFMRVPVIGYVQNKKLLSEYKGLRDSKAGYEKKLATWQSNLDTLSLEFRKEVEVFQATSSKMTAKEKKLTEELLSRKEDELVQYKNAVEQKAKEEEAQIVSSSLNQINNYIQEFGKKKGYDYIIGVTDEGNMLYGRNADDITDQLLQDLNNTYSGK